MTIHAPAVPGDRDRVLVRLEAAYDDVMHRAAVLHAGAFMDIALTMSQAKVLYLLALGPLRISEAAHRLGVATPTASQLIDRLVELGFVVRRDDPADRRHVVVTSTPEGVRQLDLLRELGNREFRRVLDEIPDPDLSVLEQAFGVLRRAVDAVATTPPAPVVPNPSEEAVK
jgi:DNA-binding MarR family transcriptional regulator